MSGKKLGKLKVKNVFQVETVEAIAQSVSAKKMDNFAQKSLNLGEVITLTAASAATELYITRSVKIEGFGNTRRIPRCTSRKSGATNRNEE